MRWQWWRSIFFSLLQYRAKGFSCIYCRRNNKEKKTAGPIKDSVILSVLRHPLKSVSRFEWRQLGLTQTHLETLTIIFPVGFTILYIGFPRTNITENNLSVSKTVLVHVGRFDIKKKTIVNHIDHRYTPIERTIRTAGTRNATKKHSVSKHFVSRITGVSMVEIREPVLIEK